MKSLVWLLLFVALFGYDEQKIKGSTPCDATLISQASGNTKAVLYIHGYNDYFFHDHIADAFDKRGYDFYAIDLHGYGRSIDCAQSYNIDAISDYYTELDNAIAVIKSKGVLDITILAHSQGGLLASSYAIEHTNFNRIILNAPFYEIQTNFFVKHIAMPIAAWFGQFFPNALLPDLRGKSYYDEELHTHWAFDTTKKKLKTDGVYLGYLHAILGAQARLREGVEYKVPILLLSSSLNGDPSIPEELCCRDVIVNVEAMDRMITHFKGDITRIKIDGAKHDVFLSDPAPQAKAMEAMFGWLESKGTN